MLPCITENIESKRIFDLVVSQITKLGVMKEQDGISVSMLANELALGEHAAHMAVKSGGDVIEGKGGIPMMNPWARARRESRDAAWRIITHFGLTASSRVAVPEQLTGGGGSDVPQHTTSDAGLTTAHDVSRPTAIHSMLPCNPDGT